MIFFLIFCVCLWVCNINTGNFIFCVLNIEWFGDGNGAGDGRKEKGLYVFFTIIKNNKTYRKLRSRFSGGLVWFDVDTQQNNHHHQYT